MHSSVCKSILIAALLLWGSGGLRQAHLIGHETSGSSCQAASGNTCSASCSRPQYDAGKPGTGHDDESSESSHDHQRCQLCQLLASLKITTPQADGLIFQKPIRCLVRMADHQVRPGSFIFAPSSRGPPSLG